MKRIYPDGWDAMAKLSEMFLVSEPPEATNAFDCGNCGGTDFMYYFNITGGPYKRHPGKNSTYVEGKGWYSGNLVGEYCPVCNGDKQNEFMKRICGLTSDDYGIRVEDFKPLSGKEEALAAAQYLKALTPAPLGFYTLWGNYGVGKTTLLKGLTNAYRVANVVTKYVRMSDILDEVRRTYSDNVKLATEKVVADYRDYQALMIDEVDRVYLTEWAKDIMFSLLDYRYIVKGRKLTVMATNTNPMEFGDDLKYLGSRMSEGTIVEVGGADVRPAAGKLNNQ